MTEEWKFHVGPDGLEIHAPVDVDRAMQTAIWDLATSDIGNSIWTWNEYSDALTISAHDSSRASERISGNATSLHIEGDDVVLEAQYNQWPTVRIPMARFEAFFNQFGEFLRNLGSGS